MLLWVALLAKLEETRPPVLLIDEAENLYTSGKGWAERRGALRTLAFYTSSTFPAGCIVMAMTPAAFDSMRKEARELLLEADEMNSTLDLEDVSTFRANLAKFVPDQVPVLTADQRVELCGKVRQLHKSVRGAVEIPGWEDRVQRLVRLHKSPRPLIRSLVDELESLWWSGAAEKGP
jgi:hypothetical protein